MAALALSTLAGCIRFRSDALPDAGGENGEPDGESDANGGDVVVLPPVCEGLNPNAPESIAGDLITQLLNDCRLRRQFANIPPVGVTHLQECLTAQIGQVMGCRHVDGQPYKYPTFDSKGQFCRDMRSSHSSISASDGDFDAFVADLNVALEANGLKAEEAMRVLTVFGATRNDIVRIKDAGPTLPCDAPDAT